MNKQIIATLVGAALLFLWQFLSWAILPVHQAMYGYTPNQDQIMTALNQNLNEEGTYMLPNVPPGTSHEQAQKDMEVNKGKPWAMISYHKSFDTSMGMNMFRAFCIDLISVFLLTLLLLRMTSIDYRTTIISSVSVGIIGYLTIPYLNSIWFNESSIGYLVDAVVSWGAVGLWLGWILGRK
ncbi:MAG: hypothetical protein U0V49_13650 [Saprospiraceae bacterium]